MFPGDDKVTTRPLDAEKRCASTSSPQADPNLGGQGAKDQLAACMRQRLSVEASRVRRFGEVAAMERFVQEDKAFEARLANVQLPKVYQESPQGPHLALS